MHRCVRSRRSRLGSNYRHPSGGAAQESAGADGHGLGKLEVVNGFIGIKTDGASYILPRLRMLVGFVKEIQEGAAVKIEGYAYPIPSWSSSQGGYSILAITKLSIAGKDYDFGQFGGPFPFGRRGGMMGRGMRPGMWEGERW